MQGEEEGLLVDDALVELGKAEGDRLDTGDGQHLLPGVVLEMDSVLSQGQPALCKGDEFCPCLGQSKAPPPPGTEDQLGIQLFFQVIQPVAQGGLGDAQGFSGFREVFAVYQGDERLYQTRIHIFSFDPVEIVF